MVPILCGLACENRKIQGSPPKKTLKNFLVIWDMTSLFINCTLYPKLKGLKETGLFSHKNNQMQLFIKHLLYGRYCAKNKEYNGKKKTITGQRGQLQSE